MSEATLPSLDLLSGSEAFAGAGFVATALVALALGLGWRTRLATVGTWLLLHALHVMLVTEPIVLPGERQEPRRYRPLANMPCAP